MAFTCSICAEESTRICVRCTKDACDNHLCEKCGRCSDCCECEVVLDDSPHASPASSARTVLQAVTGITRTEPPPEPAPGPEPDPFPVEEPEPEAPEQSQPAE
jgi:hypothetical protein